jgi:hypothetical protein
MNLGDSSEGVQDTGDQSGMMVRFNACNVVMLGVAYTDLFCRDLCIPKTRR